MTNRGVVPVDITTDIGKMRTYTRDTTYVALDPPEVGYGDYTNYSDDELQMFLDRADDSITRALGYYYLDLAAQASLVAISISDFDLKINQENRAKQLRETADSYFAQANAEDIANGTTDFFDSFEFGGTNGDLYPVVEGVDYPVWDDE
ncbi:MAG: hypothetical protein M0R66_02685 [Candidatus Omnitrophica bacterium]|nr:hypothetical protein [Sphaerochaeta sp.]MCK9603247.1 hypothetical protein [Candidatus Omnitrophota bacterium]